jgi:hypothetical protein
MFRLNPVGPLPSTVSLFHSYVGIFKSNVLVTTIPVLEEPLYVGWKWISVSLITATTFSGAGTGLTGTATSLSIGGNAATATNVAGIVQNSFTTYGNTATTTTKNGYYGLLLGASTAHLNVMADTSGNGGIYQESVGTWPLYWNASNACLGIAGSTTSAAYKIYINGSAYSTGSFVAASDVRIKENIVTVDSALDKTIALRGVYYNKIDDKTKKREIGVIAQEVQKVIPEAVTYAEDVDQYGVEYGKLAGLFIEAIKELNAEVKVLKAEIEILKRK